MSLSPLLFALSLEPFLASIRQNSNIHGITVGQKEHKYTAYADDILFYIQQPEISLSNLISVLSEYGLISNFKINYTKSEILNISVPQTEVQSFKTLFLFTWQPASLKYLGISLTPVLHKLFQANYMPLLNTIRRDLSCWNSLAHIWLGRVNVVKMNVLPRLLFMFQIIPFGVPPGYLSLLQSIVGKYIWKHSKLHLSRSVLCRSKK